MCIYIYIYTYYVNLLYNIIYYNLFRLGTTYCTPEIDTSEVVVDFHPLGCLLAEYIILVYIFKVVFYTLS